MKPIVALVGRPNVGKSTLFNALAGKRISIVEDTPGVTRDRIYTDVNWNGRDFTIVDTGGIEPDSKDVLLSGMRAQAEIAIETAHVIVFVTDVRAGLSDSDMKVSDLLRRSGKKIVLAVNKVDDINKFQYDVYEFFNLGLGDPISISASQLKGLGDLMDKVVEYLPESSSEEEDDDRPRVAIVGKPNVGKSSIINKLLGSNRVLVSDIAGTTRDAIDTSVIRNGNEYIFIDTAGLRRKSKVDTSLEHYMILRTVSAVERSDVVIIVIDAAEGITEQDAKVAGIAHDQGKACIIAVNKWDLVEKDNSTVKKFTEKVRTVLSFMPYAEIVFISAHTGQRLNKLFDMIDICIDSSCRRIQTGVLNEIVSEAVTLQQPPTDKGKALKIRYTTQVGVKPPTFVIFVNSKELMHFSYLRYIENKVREAFAFTGTPLKFIVREKDKENQ
ncbi:MAG: ribosome biogenesis GTPase Der [Lachnospiraceae bacterium]|nr:ribosome biogenesis GTPase Der [Lachnospiraceae bacterium]